VFTLKLHQINDVVIPDFVENIEDAVHHVHRILSLPDTQEWFSLSPINIRASTVALFKIEQNMLRQDLIDYIAQSAFWRLGCPEELVAICEYLVSLPDLHINCTSNLLHKVNLRRCHLSLTFNNGLFTTTSTPYGQPIVYTRGSFVVVAQY